MHKLLLNRDIYTDFVQTEIPTAGRFLWLVTADLKDLHVETDNGFEPFLALLAHLVEKGVAVRLMHAKEPGPRFREDFDNYESLINNELFERVLCCLLYTSPSPRDGLLSRMPSSA